MTKASFDAPADPGAMLFLESTVALALARLVVLMVPFRVYSRAMGKNGESSPETTHAEVLSRVRWALDSVSRHAPWRSKCLEQALAAKMMLRRRGIANTLYVAVARDAALEAHAWLRSGNICVTGEAEFDRYTVVGRFADEARR